MRRLPSPEELEPPFRGKRGLELLREIIRLRSTHAVNVVDPHGRCSELLKEALDPTDIARFAEEAIRKLERVERGEWVVMVVDARRLPRRPKNPYRRVIWELLAFSTTGALMMVFYTDDPEGRPRWVNSDGPFIEC